MESPHFLNIIFAQLPSKKLTGPGEYFLAEIFELSFDIPDAKLDDHRGTETAHTYSSADDNILIAFAISMQKLMHYLETESSVAIKWFRDKKMIVYPRKYMRNKK